MPEPLERLEEAVRLERAGLLDRALALFQSIAATSADPEEIAAALTHEADVLRTSCDWPSSLRAARRAQEVAREARLPGRLANAVVAEANVLVSQGDYGAATMLLDTVATESQDPRVRGIALQNLGTILAHTGQLRAAERAFTESLANFRNADYPRGEAISLNNFGRLALDNGEPERAEPLLEQALRLGRELEDLEVAAVASLNLAFALSAGPNLERAHDLASSALGYFVGCRNAWREIECLRLIGDINEKCDDCENASRCYDLALRMAVEIGARAEEEAVQARLDALRERSNRSRGAAGDLDS